MLLKEANARLKTPITLEELGDIHTLYCLLDLSKDDFCKIVDVLGVDVLANHKERYENLRQGQILMKEKIDYENRKKAISAIDEEFKALTEKRAIMQSKLEFCEIAMKIRWESTSYCSEEKEDSK